MKKPTQKRIKECLKDIENNFSELIDAIIFYEQNNMDDWSYDIISYLEKQSNTILINQLFNDLQTRNELDKTNPLYKSLWYSIFNDEQHKQNTYTFIMDKINTEDSNIFLPFLKSLDDGEDSDGEKNVRNLLQNFTQKNKII